MKYKPPSWSEDTTQTRSPEEWMMINRVFIRTEMLDAIRIAEEKYHKGKAIGPDKTRAQISRMYREIKQSYIKSGREDLQPLIDEAETFQELLLLADKVDEFLYDKGFIRPKEYLDPKDPRNID
jgi:hemolysin activation/secretion protein